MHILISGNSSGTFTKRANCNRLHSRFKASPGKRTSHKAAISWQSIDTATIAGYKVFRGVLGNPLPLNPLNTTLVKEASFVDSTCGADSLYCYFVAAVSRTGQQGNYSNTDTIRSAGTYTLANIMTGISFGTNWTQFAVRKRKIPVPTSLYKDVEVDLDGTVYLYDYGNSRIVIYAKRQ